MLGAALEWLLSEDSRLARTQIWAAGNRGFPVRPPAPVTDELTTCSSSAVAAQGPRAAQGAKPTGGEMSQLQPESEGGVGREVIEATPRLAWPFVEVELEYDDGTVEDVEVTVEELFLGSLEFAEETPHDVMTNLRSTVRASLSPLERDILERARDEKYGVSPQNAATECEPESARNVVPIRPDRPGHTSEPLARTPAQGKRLVVAHSLSELMTQEIPEPQWILRDLLAFGAITSFGGFVGAGKTPSRTSEDQAPSSLTRRSWLCTRSRRTRASGRTAVSSSSAGAVLDFQSEPLSTRSFCPAVSW
jgi:hypothetical protein